MEIDKNEYNNDIMTQDAPLTAEERILGYVDKNGYIIRNDVDKLLGVSQSTANRILKRMVNGGLILQDGNGRNTKYMKNSTKNEY